MKVFIYNTTKIVHKSLIFSILTIYLFQVPSSNLRGNLSNLILWNNLFLHFVALNCTRGKVDAVGFLDDLK